MIQLSSLHQGQPSILRPDWRPILPALPQWVQYHALPEAALRRQFDPHLRRSKHRGHQPTEYSVHVLWEGETHAFRSDTVLLWIFRAAETLQYSDYAFFFNLSPLYPVFIACIEANVNYRRVVSMWVCVFIKAKTFTRLRLGVLPLCWIKLPHYQSLSIIFFVYFPVKWRLIFCFFLSLLVILHLPFLSFFRWCTCLKVADARTLPPTFTPWPRRRTAIYWLHAKTSPSCCLESLAAARPPTASTWSNTLSLLLVALARSFLVSL